MPLDVPEIAAGVVQLLPLDPGDARDLAPVLEDEEIRRWMDPGRPEEDGKAERWVAERLADVAAGTCAAWAVRTAVGGELAGLVNLHHVDLRHATGEIGFVTAPAWRRHGIARTAVGAATRYGFGGLGLHRIVLWHAVENAASCAVARSSGYALEGTTRSSWVLHGVRVDEHLHARLRDDPEPSR